MADDLSKGCYRLVLEDRNKLILIKPVPEVGIALLPATVLPVNEVRAWRILPHDDSCD